MRLRRHPSNALFLQNSEDSPGDTLTRITDVEAFSYNYGEYDAAHQRYPWKPVIGGESASCVSGERLVGVAWPCHIVLDLRIGAADRSYYGPTNSTTGHVNADDIGCVVSGASLT